MSDYEKILEKMRSLSDEALKEIVLVSFEDYTDYALEAAKEVLAERGISAQLDAPAQTSDGDLKLESFKDCILSVDYALVEKKLQGLFKEPDRNLERYRQIFLDLKLMKAVSEEPIYLFIAQIREDLSLGYPFDVFGMEPGQEGYFGLEMFSWSEWLGLKIFDKSKNLILNLGLDEFVALCLKKMTTFGFTEGEIEEKIRELDHFDEDFFPEDGVEV